MGDLHDAAVEDIYKTLDFLINDYDRDVFWDDVYMEQDYFEGQTDPRVVPERDRKGKQVGEMDVLLVKEMDAPEENWMKYFEVKPERCGTTYAEDQTERAKSFFGPRGWNVLTEIHTVPEWEDNWYDSTRIPVVDEDELDSSGSDAKYDAELSGPELDDYITRVERELLDDF